ncbi:hypothetical protein [Mangrovibacterium lignilyticum]|uniref:hypothetical protein n=1 Tax=Mangrovibacterium lignilyticum TaxID=2668052 RepID=UPI0013D52E34|nr:hypothetical protein [Mangrovibacterium lignilyticum]
MIKYSFAIPRMLAEQFSFQRTLVQLLAEKALAWSVPEVVVATVTGQSNTYENRYEVSGNSQTQSPALTVARNDAWATLETTIYSIYNRYLLYNDAISAEDRDTLHISEVHIGGRTGYDAPTVSPAVNLSSEDVSTLHVNYTTSIMSSSHRKPVGVAFCELACKIGGEPPFTIEECQSHYFVSRSHQELVFNPEQRGNTVYAFARWVNRNGKTGPWGNRITAIVP